MARPQKEGLDYFPHDTDASNDEKIEALRALYGNNGYAFYFIMLERIYRSNDFEIEVSDAETIQILSKKCGINPEEFQQILNTSIKRGCFDKASYEKRGVLTSNGIKKRASIVVEKREKMRSSYENKRKIISDAETRQETPQRKEKKSKEKKSNIKPSLSEKYSDESIEIILSKKLFELMKKNNPKVKEPNFQTWAKSMDHILRIDRRSEEDVRKIIELSQKDSFWKANILSTLKLREKFDQLYIKFNVKNESLNEEAIELYKKRKEMINGGCAIEGL